MKTHTVKNSLNPKWNSAFIFYRSQIEKPLTIKVTMILFFYAFLVYDNGNKLIRFPSRLRILIRHTQFTLHIYEGECKGDSITVSDVYVCKS